MKIEARFLFDKECRFWIHGTLFCILTFFQYSLVAQSTSPEYLQSRLNQTTNPKERLCILYELSLIYLSKNPDSVQVYATEMLQIGGDINEIETEADAMFLIGQARNRLGKSKLALEAFLFARQKYKLIDEDEKRLKNEVMLAQALGQFGEYNESSSILESILVESRRTNRKELEAQILYTLGNNRRNQGEYIHAIASLKLAYAIFDSLSDNSNLLLTGISISECYRRIGANDKAIISILQNLTHLKERDAEFPILMAKIQLIAAYCTVDRYWQARREGLEAICLAKRLNSPMLLADTYVELSSAYISLSGHRPDLLDSSITYMKESIDIYRSEGSSAKKKLGRAILMLGYLKRYKGDFQSANQLYNLAMKIFVDKKDTLRICLTLDARAEIYYIENKIDSALATFENVEQLAILLGSRGKYLMNSNYKSKARCFGLLKQYDKAYSFLYRFVILNDSLNVTATAMQRLELEEEYENEIRDKAMLDKINENALSYEKQTNTLLVFKILCAFISILGIIFFILYMINREHKMALMTLQLELEGKNKHLMLSNQQLEESELMIKRLNNQLYHYVTDVIRRARGFALSTVAKIRADEDRKHVIRIAERILALEEIHRILLDFRVQEKVNMPKFIKVLTNKMVRELWENDIEILLNLEIESVDLTNLESQAIGLILEECVSNAIKYAFENLSDPEISICLSSIENIVNFKVCDNGIGMGINDQNNSITFGISFIQDIVRKDLKGELSISTTQGTSIEINFTHGKIKDSNN